MYFPVKEFSPRYGDSFFTFEFQGYHAVDNGCFNRYIVYDIKVTRGRNSWSVKRRFSQVHALGSVCLKMLASGATNSNLTTIGKPPLSLPPKTYCTIDIEDKDFLRSRQASLFSFLDSLLKQLSANNLTNTIEVLEFLGLTSETWHKESLSMQFHSI